MEQIKGLDGFWYKASGNLLEKGWKMNEQEKMKHQLYGLNTVAVLETLCINVIDIMDSIEAFKKEYGVGAGAEVIRGLDEVQKNFDVNRKKLVKMVGIVSDGIEDYMSGKKMMPRYQIQLIDDDLVFKNTDGAVYLKIPEEVLDGNMKVKLSKRFLTVYDKGFMEWRYYPETKIYLYSEENREECSSFSFVKLLKESNSVMERKRQEDLSKKANLIGTIDGFFHKYDPNGYEKVYANQEDAMIDFDRCLLQQPDALKNAISKTAENVKLADEELQHIQTIQTAIEEFTSKHSLKAESSLFNNLETSAEIEI